MSLANAKPEQLRCLKCLNQFSDAEQTTFLEFVEPATCKQNDVLFEEGDTGDCMYLILEGQMRVFTRKKGQVVILKQLGPGDAFGDIALFNGTPRLASVDATADSQLLKLTSSGLERLQKEQPTLSKVFLQTLTVSLSQMYRDFH